MNVKQIRELINEYRCKEPTGLDSVSAAVVRGYKRMRVTEAEQLLSYIDAVCVTSSKSAHILFIQLTEQPYPELEKLAQSRFRIGYGYDSYTSAIADLYDYNVSGDGDRFLVVNDLNVYTKLFKLSDSIYCKQNSLQLYNFKPVAIHYMRMLFGEDYIKDITYPNDMSCAELVFAYNNPSKLQFENGDSVVTVVHKCKDFKPMSNPNIVDYSIGTITTGTIVTITARKGANLSVADLESAVETLIGKPVKEYTVQKLDKYRLAVFIKSQE